MKNNFWPPAFVLTLLFICTPAAAVAERKGDQTVVNQAKPGLGQTGFPIPQRAAAAPQRPVSSPPARFPTPAPAPTIHPQQMKNPAASNRVTGLPGFGSLSVGPAVSMTQLPPVAKPPVSGTNIVPSAPPRAINQYRPANGGANSGGVTRQVTEPQLGNKRPRQPPTLNLGATPVPRLTPQAPAANGEVPSETIPGRTETSSPAFVGQR